MELTEKQQLGLRIALERYLNHEKYTIISGYAGTGKSTLVKFIISALSQYGINPEEDVVFTSFTGKATQVLQKKGNKNVSTLHRLLYEFKPRSDGTFYRQAKIDLFPYKIVVVDECSMAPKELLQQLFKHNVYIICLGDPGQLPPVNKDDDNHLLDNPHIFLDEVMRQAAESEIIQLSMKIRNGEPINNFCGKEVQVISKAELNTGMLQWADQVLCATNSTRVALNNQMRDLLGRGDMPEDGDKIICLRNYWDYISEEGENPLVNGTIGFLRNSFESFHQLPIYLGVKPERFPVVISDFITDSNESYGHLTMDKRMILEGEPTLNWKDSFKVSSARKGMYRHLVPMNFTYGYAITGHKSQGSEWNKVLVIEERFPFDKEEHQRWLYTCVTRAAEKLVLVRPN